MTYDRHQEYRENIAEDVRRPDDKAVFALTSTEPTWGELRIVAHTMLVRKRSAEVYIHRACATIAAAWRARTTSGPSARRPERTAAHVPSSCPNAVRSTSPCRR